MVDPDFPFFPAPRVPILLSPEFLATHCFRPVRKRSLLGGAREVRLAFQPAPGRTLGDVKGTIWLDERSSELRRVEFEFVNIPEESLRLDEPRGRLEFGRQPNGTWYVREWEMRRLMMRPDPKTWNPRTKFYHGVVRYLHRTRGSAVPAGSGGGHAAALLRGVFVDSTAGEGLAGAVVRVPGAEPAMTDSLGRFDVRIADMPDDSMDVVVLVEHPRLELLGLTRVEQTVTLRAGATTDIGIAIPGIASLLAVYCPIDGSSAVDDRGRLMLGMLIGRATRPDGSPLAAVSRVVAEWASDEKLGQSTAARIERRAIVPRVDGRFRLCPLPIGRTIRLHVENGAAAGPVTEIILPANGVGQIEISGTP